VILLILVALLWIAVLAPGVITKISERRSSGSIESFHDRLHLLERTGPKLIAPANRLERAEPIPLAAMAGGAHPRVRGSRNRPSLVLLETALPESGVVEFTGVDPPETFGRAVPDRMLGSDDGVSREVGGPAVRMLDGPSLGVVPQSTTTELAGPELMRPLTRAAAAERRAQAARRRRDVLGVLVTTMVLSGLLGIVPSLRLALIATGVAGFLLVVFVALAIYAVSIRAERHRASRLELGGPTSDHLADLDFSHVGPLRRLRDFDAAADGEDETELRRVVRAG